MPAHVLGQGMDDDIAAMLEGPAKVGGRHRIVDDDRHAVGVGHVRDGGEVGHIARRVADGLAKHGFRPAIDLRGHGLDIVRRREAHLDAELRQGVGEQIIGAAVEGGG
jgi:hypothetical protein